MPVWQEARKDILARWERPVVLTSEPMGSEIAAPGGEEITAAAQPHKNPDPDGRIFRDTKHLVGIETFTTPAQIQPGQRVRARINLRLDTTTQPWWNNEADDLRIWLYLPEEITIVEQRLSIPNPELPET